jgi:uncharacterized protein YutE (UPF0331/DUF86 family)
MLAIQLCADIATHITSDEAWPPAKSLAEGFNRLQEHQVIAQATAESLKRAVGLRNIVAHGYGRVDSTMVFAGATSGLRDLVDFAQDVATWLTTRP